jgi:DNA ligase-1
LRIGLREGLVLDALAAAFEREPAAVRRAAMAAGDAGAVALAARAGTLGDIEVSATVRRSASCWLRRSRTVRHTAN